MFYVSPLPQYDGEDGEGRWRGEMERGDGEGRWRDEMERWAVTDAAVFLADEAVSESTSI